MLSKLPGFLRLKLIIGEYGKQIGVVLMLIGCVVMGVAIVTHEVPTTETEIVTATDEIQISQSQEATATTNTSAWEDGETTTGTVYSTTAMQTLDIYTQSEGSVNANGTVTYTVEHRLYETGDSEPFWTTQAARTESNLSIHSEETQTTHTELNFSGIFSKHGELRDDFSRDATVETAVIAEFRLHPEGETLFGEDEIVFEEDETVEISNQIYSLNFDGTTETTEQTEIITETDFSSVILIDDLVIAHDTIYEVVIGLLLLITGVTTTKAEKRISVHNVKQRINHERYKDWITTVDNYGALDSDKKISTTDSLKELIFYANDTGNGVVYVKNVDEYVTETDNRLFVYAEGKPDGWNPATGHFGFKQIPFGKKTQPHNEENIDGDIFGGPSLTDEEKQEKDTPTVPDEDQSIETDNIPDQTEQDFTAAFDEGENNAQNDEKESNTDFGWGNTESTTQDTTEGSGDDNNKEK